MDDVFASSRQAERRSNAVLGAVVDVAIAYRDNLGVRVAQAFLRETGVPDAVAQRVLNRTAQQRTTLQRRRMVRCDSAWPRPDGA